MTFPTISYSRAAMYPLTRTHTFKTQVQNFMGDQEVRWVAQLPVTRFELVFTDVDATSINILKNFFIGQGGASTSMFSLTLPGSQGGTWNNLLLDSDTFSMTNRKANLWNVTIPLRQVRQ